MSTVTFTAPPGYRTAQCCGTCKNWEWGYEGAGNCNKFPTSLTSSNSTSFEIYSGDNSGAVCDAWEEGKRDG